MSLRGRHFIFGIAFASLMVGAPQIGTAQTVSPSAGRPDFAPAMIEHAQKMRRYKDFDRGGERIPHVIERFSVDRDPKGAIASFQPNGPTFTANNAFFKDMGTNGRSCFTCHRPENAWSVSANDVAERFEKSAGTDPIFRLVDGATCPSDDVSTLRARRRAYKLLTEKGLIRVGLAVPAAGEFVVTAIDDPYGCSTKPETGSGVLSMYRRPMPTTNIGFLSAIMWDGREPALESQAVSATLVHAQAKNAPTPEQVAQIVAFQKGIFTAQIFDNRAKFLTGDNARGGPRSRRRSAISESTTRSGLIPRVFRSRRRFLICTGHGSAPGSATIMTASARRWRTSASSSGPLTSRMTGVTTIMSAAW